MCVCWVGELGVRFCENARSEGGDGHNGKRETEGSLFSSVRAERKTQGQETGGMNV